MDITCRTRSRGNILVVVVETGRRILYYHRSLRRTKERFCAPAWIGAAVHSAPAAGKCAVEERAVSSPRELLLGSSSTYPQVERPPALPRLIKPPFAHTSCHFKTTMGQRGGPHWGRCRLWSERGRTVPSTGGGDRLRRTDRRLRCGACRCPTRAWC